MNVFNEKNNAGFAIGDRVKIARPNYTEYPLGTLGTITDTRDTVVRAEMDVPLLADTPESTHDMIGESFGYARGWSFDNADLEKVEG